MKAASQSWGPAHLNVLVCSMNFTRQQLVITDGVLPSQICAPGGSRQSLTCPPSPHPTLLRRSAAFTEEKGGEPPDSPCSTEARCPRKVCFPCASAVRLCCLTANVLTAVGASSQHVFRDVPVGCEFLILASLSSKSVIDGYLYASDFRFLF